MLKSNYINSMRYIFMHQNILLALFSVIILTLSTSSGFAQTGQTEGQGPLNFWIEKENTEEINYRKVFEQLPDEIQSDLMIEAEKEYQKCTRKGAYSKYYDCRCIAIKFLDARIKRGPEAHSQHILGEVTLECPYAAGVAGLSYRKCESMFAMGIVGDLDKFCTCFANSVAKTFSAKPSMHSQYVSYLHQKAIAECGYDEEVDNFERLERQRDILR